MNPSVDPAQALPATRAQVLTMEAKGRVLAIGDIHGCYKALTALEKAAGFADDDLVVTVGDYIDRGPQSRDVIDWLIERHGLGRLVPILGNHEEMLMTAIETSGIRASWLEFGGQETLRSYGIKRPHSVDDLRAALPGAHWDFFENACVDYFETDDHFFVHANAKPGLALADQTTDILRWQRFHAAAPHCSGKTMVCGHTPQTTGYPSSLGFAICIDTGVYAQNGWLTCLDVASGDYWQANEKGTVYENNLFGKFDDDLIEL